MLYHTKYMGSYIANSKYLNSLYNRTEIVHYANGRQLYQITGWDIYDINSNSYSRCMGVQPWLNVPHTKWMGPYIANSKYLKKAVHSYINCTGSELPPKELKQWMEHLWPQSQFVQLLYSRIAIVLSYPTSHMYRPFEVGCMSVLELYRIRITTKRIETVNGIIVTSIPIRTASVQVHSHSSQLSHNSYIQTLWN